ncbi:MAG: glycoside hydrolase family 13 protein [Candidatus Cryptobacteroides sp.]
MKRVIMILACMATLCACSNFAPESVADATAAQVTRVEPLSWWVGMRTPLQLMVYGKDISTYELSLEGGSGVSIKNVTPGDSPNYLFVDVRISANAKAGTYYLVFSKDGESFKYPYEIHSRAEGSASRESFTTSDMIYLIMPDRFANGDASNDSTDCTDEKVDRSAFFGRHGGDIRGIMNHLDYISDLGATAIWCTPLLEDNAPDGSYHGYACSDYYHIDPRFGSNELYREYVDAAHGKGLKVIMDIVTNHCGTEHWWMNDLPFKDWIHIWPEYTGSNCCFSTNMDFNASQKDQYNMESGWFVPSMPDMNLNNPFVLKYFQQWAVWWIEYAGLDGLRVDTYPYNEREPMSQWCASVRNEYPNINIVGECWTSSIPQLAYWQGDNDNWDGFNSNLPSIMDFPLLDAISAGFNEEEVNWNHGMVRIYDCVGHDFVYHDMSKMMIFPGNHDTERIADVLGKDPRKVKMAMALMATMRGIPQIFAGDEQMFVSKDRSQGHGGLRVDFPGGWEGDALDQFTAEGRAAMTVNTDGQAVAQGLAADMYDYVSRLFQWRKTSLAVQKGRTMHFLTRDNTYAFFRYNDLDKVFVYVNNTSEPKNIPWSYYDEMNEGLGEGLNVVTGEKITLSDATVVPAKTALVVDYRH